MTAPGPLDTALTYIRRGWNPVPVPFRQKGPDEIGWQLRVITEDTAPQHFNGKPQNIGIVLGPSSQGLTDVDLDCPEAIDLAPYFLPHTAAIFGRRSKPASHWLYETTLGDNSPNAVIQFRDPTTKDMIIELRMGGGKGAQTIFPGSTHESGELIEWTKVGEPSKVDGPNLRHRVAAIASAVLLIRAWPGEGGRHDAARVLGGFLARAGWQVREISQFVGALASVACDDERQDRERAAEDQAKAFMNGGNCYGYPAMVEMFGEAYARKIADWLGYNERNDAGATDVIAEPSQPVTIEIVDPSTLEGRLVPPREWHVADLIPHRTVTLKSGDGGVGKSLLAMQLCVSTALGMPWIGREVAAGRAMYLSAEDDMDEVHRRLFDICAGEGARLADLGRLRIAPLAGLDAVLAAPQGKTNVIATTPLWTALEACCEEFRPRLLVLDTSADLFAGEENNRAQVRQFIGMLRGLAIRLDMTIVLLSHPSVSGMSSGSGTSGSTAWNNSVRSRLFFRRAISQDGIEADPNLRILETKKANYSTTGTEITVRWEAGRFIQDRSATPGGLEQVTAGMRADRVFMDLLQAYTSEGRYVSSTPSANYAPAVFAKDARSIGVGKPALMTAMNRLFNAGRIKVETFGPPSRQVRRIVASDPSDVNSDGDYPQARDAA